MSLLGLFHDPFIWPFHLFVAAHIVTGSVGLLGFWVPVASRKGSPVHRLWGKVFVLSMLTTGSIAVCMSSLTIMDPVGTHPSLEFDPALIQGIFGWMMLYLAILTVNLAWYGLMCIRNRRDHLANRGTFNLFLQAILVVTAANCAWRGVQLEQVLMVGISMVGFATAGTNLWFIYKSRPGPTDWLKEHVKGLVGAGISVYTAFFAFGAVRLMPELALNPGLWAVPLVTGIVIILYHWRKIGLQQSARMSRRTA
ncbi:MAG: hypothetical protein QNJ40_08185 [Xanthomonadales bacterium]|nr:hypothetical protein [Xanthomonadales bacterium]